MTTRTPAPGAQLLAEGSYAARAAVVALLQTALPMGTNRWPRDPVIATLPDAWLDFISSGGQARE